MPGFDRTGPMGGGPMTGRGLGRCAGADYQPGFAGRGFGRKFGRGYGMGRGRGYGFFPIAPENQKELLKDRADYLENELKAIRAQLEDQQD